MKTSVVLVAIENIDAKKPPFRDDRIDLSFAGLTDAGLRFTHAYSASTNSRACRAAILTGRYPQKTGDVDPDQEGFFLYEDETTIADLFLKEDDVATGFIEKQIPGGESDGAFTDRGFRDYASYENAIDFQATLRTYLHGRDGKPFLLFVVLSQEDTARALPVLFDEVDKTGKKEKTIIVVTGCGNVNDDVSEATLRTPLFISWHNTIEAGEEESLFHSVDIMPTVCSMCGVHIPARIKTDGQNLSHLMLKNGRVPRIAYPPRFWQWDRGVADHAQNSALRIGEWKLVKPRSDSSGNKGLEPINLELFNIEKDPSEQQDLAARYPEKSREMDDELERLSAEIEADRLRFQNPTRPENSKAFGGLDIVRLEPGDGSLKLDYALTGRFDPKKTTVELYFSTRGDELRRISEKSATSPERHFRITELQNNKDYKIELRATSKNRRVARSRTRLFRTGFVPGKTVNYIHPEDFTYDPSGRSCCSPSILSLGNGRLIVSHDVYWGSCKNNLTKVFRSGDSGTTWSFLADILPCFWGKLFSNDGQIYLQGADLEEGTLVMYSSGDSGTTWSGPVVLYDAPENFIVHQAPTPVIQHQDRVWTAFEIYGNDEMRAVVASAEADSDLMVRDAWSFTPPLQLDRRWPGIPAADSVKFLEGNVVAGPDGRMFNILRLNAKSANEAPLINRVVMLSIDETNPEAPLRFHKVTEFLGGQSKFSIRYSPRLLKYHSIVNRVTVDPGQRNVVSLISSDDLETWKLERDLLNYQDNNWHEPFTKMGMQYWDWLYDGDDILAASRTGINGSHNFHNANHLTFHKFRTRDKAKIDAQEYRHPYC